MNQKTIKLLKNVSTAFVVVAVVFAFLIAGIRVFGIQVFGVLTGSMEPTYPTGSLIYVQSVDAKDLRVNDVITFSISPNVIATHRIVEVVPDETNPTVVRYRTKGDANQDVDASLVSANNIIGRVMFAVPQMGYIANYIQQPPGIYVAIFVCALMVAFVFYAESLDEKMKKASGQQPAPKAGKAPKQPRQAARQPLQQPQDDFAQGYVPQQQPQQQAYYPPQQQYPQQGYQYPQQQYPQQGYQYPQQQYPQQGYQYPQQQYPQQGYQYPQQQYPQQQYPQQGYYDPYQAQQQPQPQRHRRSQRSE